MPTAVLPCVYNHGPDSRYDVLQLMSSTKALWFFGGEQSHIQQLQMQDASIAHVPATHFPLQLWQERYQARNPTPSSTAEMEPSPLWIGASHCTFIVEACPTCFDA